MKLYTVICDFDGGTYLRQVNAKDPAQAVQLWALGHDIAGLFLDHEEDWDLTAIDGCTNCWCASALSGDKLALIHFVETAAS